MQYTETNHVSFYIQNELYLTASRKPRERCLPKETQDSVTTRINTHQAGKSDIHLLPSLIINGRTSGIKTLG